MDTETDISNAIAQLEMLGIDRQKAIKALSRYNYDVERAADFVFSGNAESDDDDTQISANNTTGPTSTNSNGLDWPWAEPTSFTNITADQQGANQQPGAANDSMNEDQLPVYMVKDYDKNHKQSLDTTSATHDPSSWSVVPFTANQDAIGSTPTTESNTKTVPAFTHSSLTWWSDPEHSSDRAAIADLPTGLRPPSYNYAYSPIIIQALFHIPLFRQAVLSYRPTPHAWGAPYNYWKGFGEPVPGYRLKSNQQTRRPSSSSSSSLSTPSTNHNQTRSSLPSSRNLMDLTVDDTGKFEDQTSNADLLHVTQQNHNDFDEQGPIELISVTQETSNSPLGQVDELVPMTKESIALAELQKLFAFLGNTKRLYGSVAHFMRATNARTVTSSTNWQVDDKSIEEFLDSVIGELVSAENASNIDQNGNWKDDRSSSLKNMFFLQAEVENGSDVDIEEIYYLNLGINTVMNSFHDCLDPLVYETFPHEAMLDGTNNDNDDLDGDNDLGSDTSDDFNNGSIPYKITTFLQVPPLLLVTLEDRHDYQQQAMKKDCSFKVEKTIYLDRYLTENKAMVLEKYRLADQWKQDIRRTKLEMTALRHDGGSPTSTDELYMNGNFNADNSNSNNNINGDPSSLDKCQILETTAKYLDSQLSGIEPTDENLIYINSIRALQQTLYQVRDDIDNKKKELEQLILDRQHSLQNLFNDSKLHKRPYDLRAVLHTDGLNGTGHYWGYIWVEPKEVNLLEDIPAQGGGWHRFCDAKVEKVTEEDVWRESTNPFALLYADRNITAVTKQEIDEVTPPDLMQFVHDDNTTFENEINNGPNDTNNNGHYSGNSSISGSSADIQQSMSRLSMNTDHGSVGYKDNNAARYLHDYDDDQSPHGDQQSTYQNESHKERIPNNKHDASSHFLDGPESEHCRHSGTIMASSEDSKFTKMATNIIDSIRISSDADCLVIKRFDTFLAQVSDKDTLGNYYQQIESSLLSDRNNDKTMNTTTNARVENEDQDRLAIDTCEPNGKQDDELGPENQDIDNEQPGIDVDELGNALDSLTSKDIHRAVQDDKTLFLLFEFYEQYLSMTQTVTHALVLFADNKFADALEEIMKSNQQHNTWRTQLMLNDILVWKYPGLGELGFNDILVKYGKACIKKLNMEAYNKACNIAYRSRGLQDGICIANLAQFVVSKSSDPKEPFLSDVGGRWLNFAELQSGSLTEDQVELLNTLVMIYLDGPTTTSAMTPASAIPSSTTTMATQQEGEVMNHASSSRFDANDTSLDAKDEPVWIAFKKSVLNAEAKLVDF